VSSSQNTQQKQPGVVAFAYLVVGNGSKSRGRRSEAVLSDGPAEFEQGSTSVCRLGGHQASVSGHPPRPTRVLRNLVQGEPLAETRRGSNRRAHLYASVFISADIDQGAARESRVAAPTLPHPAFRRYKKSHFLFPHSQSLLQQCWKLHAALDVNT